VPRPDGPALVSGDVSGDGLDVDDLQPDVAHVTRVTSPSTHARSAGVDVVCLGEPAAAEG
jgi:hypothetical protein